MIITIIIVATAKHNQKHHHMRNFFNINIHYIADVIAHPQQKNKKHRFNDGHVKCNFLSCTTIIMEEFAVYNTNFV